MGAWLRRHKVTGEQVGGVDEAGGLDVVGVVSGMSPQPVAECAGAHGGEFAGPSVAYVASLCAAKSAGSRVLWRRAAQRLMRSRRLSAAGWSRP